MKRIICFPITIAKRYESSWVQIGSDPVILPSGKYEKFAFVNQKGLRYNVLLMEEYLTVEKNMRSERYTELINRALNAIPDLHIKKEFLKRISKCYQKKSCLNFIDNYDRLEKELDFEDEFFVEFFMHKLAKDFIPFQKFQYKSDLGKYLLKMNMLFVSHKAKELQMAIKKMVEDYPRNCFYGGISIMYYKLICYRTSRNKHGLETWNIYNDIYQSIITNQDLPLDSLFFHMRMKMCSELKLEKELVQTYFDYLKCGLPVISKMPGVYIKELIKLNPEKALTYFQSVYLQRLAQKPTDQILFPFISSFIRNNNTHHLLYFLEYRQLLYANVDDMSNLLSFAISQLFERKQIDLFFTIFDCFFRKKFECIQLHHFHDIFSRIDEMLQSKELDKFNTEIQLKDYIYYLLQKAKELGYLHKLTLTSYSFSDLDMDYLDWLMKKESKIDVKHTFDA